MSSFIDQIKIQYKMGSMTLKLIMVNAGIFLASLVATVLIKLFDQDFYLLEYFAAPANYDTLLLRPWTVISYMFMHSLDGIGHLFWNMVLLYFAGTLFQQNLGGRKLLSTYFLGGIIGFLLFNIGYNFLPAIASPYPKEILIGASASVTAILVGIGVYMPNYEVRLLFVPYSFKLIWIVLFFVTLDFIRLQSSIGIAGANTGGWLAHIGGAFYGFIFASQMRQGKNIGKWFEEVIDWIVNLFKSNPTKIKRVRKKRDKNKRQNSVPRDDYEYNEVKVDNQQKIDAILDKISKSGYDSLTKVEKDFLFRQSKN